VVFISREQLKVVRFIGEKIDRGAGPEEYLSIFGGWRFVQEEIGDSGGYYDFYENEIHVEKNVSELEMYDIFFHEMGHLIHEMVDHSDFYNHYVRRNIIFSELLKSEQQASLIGIELWKLKFPGVPLVSPPGYFCDEHIKNMMEYYREYDYEIDEGFWKYIK